MEIVLNRCYGGFHLPEEFCSMYGLNRHLPIERTNSRLVEWVRAHAGEDGYFEEGYACLKVVTIPDSSTDWTLTEYDGLESLIYVVDGKLHYAH